MENVSVSEVYLVGDDLLDAQHKVVLSYMGKVYASLLAGEEGNEIFEMVDRLDTFCKLHFWDEEKVMEEINFQDILVHKAQHALFVTHLENFMGRYEEQSNVKNIDDLLFLRKWFLEHIEAFDKKYAEFKKQANS